MFDGLAPNFAVRSNQAELIDGSGYAPDEFVEALNDLRQINRWLGGKRALAKHLFPMIRASSKRQIRLLPPRLGSTWRP